MRQILIADSGSTKTDWLLVDTQSSQSIATKGINPFYMTTEELDSFLQNELCPQILEPKNVEEIDFYGAGCRGEQADKLAQSLSKIFPKAKVLVASDLLGAARALCGDESGIACILGTGANSCLYNGQEIVDNTPALGYILGDEGSGAVLGKRLIGDILKRQCSNTLSDAFFKETSLTVDVILDKVYKQPFPNRFLASLTTFLSAHKQESEVQHLLKEEFARFLQRNIRNYNRPELPLHFVGSIAFYFSEALESSVTAEGLRMGSILKAPVEALSTYHLSKC